MNRGIIAEIDLQAVSNNLRAIKKLTNNRPVIAVVKADSYGHGAVEVSKRLVREGVVYLAVAFAEEARELRDAGIGAPILVLFDPDTEDIFRYNLVPVIADKKRAVELSAKAERCNTKLPVHIKIDTGMGRLGLRDNVVRDVLEISELRGLHIEGVMSHFSEADLADASFARMQIGRFSSIKTELTNAGLKIKFFHMANSAAVLTLPEAYFDAVRPGLMLYGYSPIQKSEVKNPELITPDSELIPAMTVKARIIALRRLPANTPVSYGRTFLTKRDSLIGVMSLGYADGFSRRFSNNAEALVRGRRVPVVGRVCMDLTMLDLTDAESAEEGDEVAIIGKQGSEYIAASELAMRADTIPYEILTSLGTKAKRLYY